MATQLDCMSIKNRYQKPKSPVDEFVEVTTTLDAMGETYKFLIENANDAIIVLQNGRVKYANPRSLELSGISADDLKNTHFTEYIHPDDRAMVIDRLHKRLNGEKVPHTYSLRIVNRQGKIMWAEVNAALIQWDGAPATLNIMRDISSSKLIENQGSKVENLTTVRTLAGGMAHGFNNLLMGIQGSVSLLALDIKPNDVLYENLERIETCVDEAARLAKQLVGFAQCGKYNIEKIYMNQVVDEAVSVLGRGSKEIDIQKSCPPDLWTVSGDKGQIDQVLSIILLNAWQAIDQKGDIIVSTQNVTLFDVRGPESKLRPGKYVKVSVQDTGVGMDEELCKRVFEPFFTTKETEGSRGLGLSCAFGIVANHNGLIDVTSVKGVGSTFTVLLPADDRK